MDEYLRKGSIFGYFRNSNFFNEFLQIRHNEGQKSEKENLFKDKSLNLISLSSSSGLEDNS